MGWANDMHWEQIPGQLDKDILNRQLDEATREDIPVRCMQVRRNEDGKEKIFYEWFVKPSDCVIKGRTTKARKIMTHINNIKNTYYNLAFAIPIMTCFIIQKMVLTNRWS